jgi:DNA-binding Lrp family transcriptional regulator
MLAAMTVPEPQLGEAAAQVSAHPEVNHNYSRNHEWNLWFVVTAPDSAQLARTLTHIETECGYPMIRLPLIEDYHIDLGFDLEGAATPRIAAPSMPAAGPIALCQKERALVAALEAGLPLVPNPYADLGAHAGMSEVSVIATLKAWVDAGIVARLGVVVRHHELGFTANAMAVWDVPDHLVGVLGRRLAASDCVTLCYRRARDLPSWRYNLYCMIHGRSYERVLAQVEWLRESCGMLEPPFAVLFSRQRFKQRGARYAPPPEPVHG